MCFRYLNGFPSELQVDVAESCDSLTSSECSSLGPDLDNLLRADFPLLIDGKIKISSLNLKEMYFFTCGSVNYPPLSTNNILFNSWWR